MLKNSRMVLVLALLANFVVGTPILADYNEDNILGTTTTETDENGNIKTIITVKNRQIETYNSSDSATTSNNSSITVNGTFFNDKYSQELTTILSVSGFVPSGRKFIFPPHNTWVGSMLWPVQYSTTVKNSSKDNTVKISDSTPANTIRNKEVSNSITYGIGGGVKIEGKTPGANLDSSVAFTKTISYQQPDYETVKTVGTTQMATWKTTFTETTDGYTRNSWNPTYGNEMFMYGRYTYDVKKNFTSDYKLSPLITGGFSPSYGIVLKARKNTKKSTIEVFLDRQSETYKQEWSGFNWYGSNYLDQTKPDWSSGAALTFEVDWQNHTIRFIA
ncbi:TPA: enterococcus pore-forming toxin Epx [Enterococcus hirae]